MNKTTFEAFAKGESLWSKLIFTLGLVCFLLSTSVGNAQLLQQDFSSSTTVANYAATTPTNGQFNAISSSGSGTVLSINTTGSNKLRFARTGNAGSFSRTTDFSPTPTSMLYRFDMTLSANSAAQTTAGTLFIGNGFGTANSVDAGSLIHSRIGINFTTTAGQFSLRDLGASTNSANFTGTQTVTWAINHSGATLTYRAPDGTFETVANDKHDVWIGTTRVFNDIAALTATQSLTDIKFVFSNGNGTIDFDNFLIDPIPAVPSSNAATSVGSAGFTANWSAISGVTGYRVDVATDAAFTSMVSGYNNLYVSGQATNSLNVTGLNANTTYYYRVRGASQYAVGEFAGGNSATQNLTTNSSFIIGWANLQSPTADIAVAEGTSVDYYGQVFSDGVTNSAGEGTLIDAWVGYSTSNSDPSLGGWTWVNATYNLDVGNNDEYKGTLSGLTPGTYYVAYRYRVGASGPFIYGGKNGFWSDTTHNAKLTVTSLLVDWCNIQYPASGTITAGDAYNVYAKVYLDGVTNAGGQGAGITAWIGYSTSNTNPNTWTNWVPAAYNVDQGNDDEYFANIATALSPGIYYYASRFQRAGSTEYRYGDINGIWDSTADNGVLTVTAATPVVTAASPTGTYNSAFSYNVIATNAPTAYAIVSGSLPTGLSFNTTNGLLSGTPTQVGTFAVGVTATNSGGTSAPATITITIGQASQTITFGALAAKVYGDAAFALSATATSGLTVSYSSSNTDVATVSGNTVTIVGSGTTTITASQAGDVNYTAATAVAQTLTVSVKNLNIIGVTANDKVQDGTTAATLSGAPSFSGIVAGDESGVALTGTAVANFASALPGNGIAVTVTGYALTGSRAIHYSLSQPSGLTAAITALGVPTATAATAILTNGFTANWNAVAGATSYELDVYTKTEVLAPNLFFSEYVEGSSTNKAIEIYNGTGADVDLSNYTLVQFNNGATRTTGTRFALQLSGTLASGDVYVIANSGSSSVILASADLSTGSSLMTFNGDDALAIYNSADVTVTGAVIDAAAVEIDILGKIGEDPGAEWGSGTASTADNTIRRKATVIGGVTSNPTTFTVSTEWDGFDNDTFSGLGAHTFAGGTAFNYVAGFQSLTVGDVTSYQVTGLDPQTQYYFRVRAISGTVTSASSNEVGVVTKPTSCTWNGTAWSNIDGPDAAIEAVIAGVYSTSVHGNFTAKKVTVNSGSLTVNSGGTLTIVNDLVNNLTAAEVVIESNGNLLQSADVDNTGAVTVKRNSSLIKRLDYTLWSSPVAGQNLLAFSPLTFANRFYYYNSVANIYESVPSPSTTAFEAGKGVLIRVPNNHPAVTPTAFAGQFAGVPHNGDYSITMQDDVAGQRFNLVGNPYPSPIDALAFIENANNSSSITGTLYFFRKTNGSGLASYCTWTSGGFVTNNDSQTFDLNDVIQTGQAFFVEATGNNDQVLFTNAMRVDNHANQFFRNGQATTSVERHRIWLNASNEAGAFSQAMIGYMSNATNGLDTRIDGKYINDGEIALASLLDAVPMAIQGRGLPFEATDVVPMQFKAATAGSYTISLARVEGMFANGQSVFLRDTVLGVTHNLTEGAYTFTVGAGTFNDRFQVLYQSTLGTDTPVLEPNQVMVYASGATAVTVNSGSAMMQSVKVFDIRGRLLTESHHVNASQITLDVNGTNEVLLVQVTTTEGVVVTKKFVQ